jgi:ATP-dependent 26S proteasome regulatory subunit
MGVPVNSWVEIHAYNEKKKEDELLIHTIWVKLNEDILETSYNDMNSDILTLHVNPITHMNLNNANQNNWVFVKNMHSDLHDYSTRAKYGIDLPKIKELKLSIIKTLKRSDNPLKAFENYIRNLSAPLAIKINDVIFVPKYDLFKVKSIVFEKGQKEEITKLGMKLPKTIEVSQLSYSKYPWYLLDKNSMPQIDLGDKRISSFVPDLSYIMDYPFNVMKGYHYEFLKELRDHFLTNKNTDKMLEIIILQTPKRNQIDSILQGLAFNLNMLYDKESALDYCSISGVKSLFEIFGVSAAPGLYHITHFKYINLILEQSSTGQPSKKDKDSIEIRLSTTVKEALTNLEQFLINKSEKLYMFIEVDRVMDVLPEIRQMCTKVINIPNPEAEKDIEHLIMRNELMRRVPETELYKQFVPLILPLLKKRSIDEIWSIMRKWIDKFSSKNDWHEESTIEEQYFAIAQKVCKDVDDIQKSFGDSPLKVPEVKWKDVGGLGLAKHDILQTIELPLKNPGLFKNGLIQRGGLLLYGPPGTGKTLLAKAIATECELSFMSVKGPEVLNMYVGESEKNIREIFEKARSHSPWVIFFDELDSLAPARGNGSDSNQVMDRIVAQLLTEIDGVNSKGQVFVIGATNRPDLLDPALMRPGRFDKKIYLGIAKEPQERVKILKAQTRKFQLDPDVDFSDIEGLVPKNFTGADFAGLTNEAYMQAARRGIQQIQDEIKDSDQDESGYLNIPEEIKEKYQTVVIWKDDFIRAASSVTPSLSLQEIASYDSIRDK